MTDEDEGPAQRLARETTAIHPALLELADTLAEAVRSYETASMAALGGKDSPVILAEAAKTLAMLSGRLMAYNGARCRVHDREVLMRPLVHSLAQGMADDDETVVVDMQHVPDSPSGADRINPQHGLN